MPVVRMKLKDAIQLSLEKERLLKLSIEQPLKIYTHVGVMPDCDEQYIVRLFAEGKSYQDISKITGYSVGAIGRHVRKYKELGLTRCNTRRGASPAIKIPELVVA